MSQAIFSDGLGYEGKVTLTLRNNNRVLMSKTYKNNGTAQLFRFLGNCLTGAFEEAKALLPNKILLLYNTKDTLAEAQKSPTSVEQCSLWHSYIQTPKLVSDSATAQAKVVYSFEVPKNSISGIFNQVALYSAGATSYNDFSAYYFLIDSFGNLENIDAKLWSATTVLLIEWELSLSNKNVEINNNTQGEQV